MTSRSILCVSLAAMICLMANVAGAANNFYFVKKGVATYDVVVDSVTDIGGIDMTITYDPNAYTIIGASWTGFAAGRMGGTDTGRSGLIHMVSMSTSPMTGSGSCATISLRLTGKATPTPTLDARLVSPMGGNVAASFNDPNVKKDPPKGDDTKGDDTKGGDKKPETTDSSGSTIIAGGTGTSNPGTSNPGTSNPGASNPGTSYPGTSYPGTVTLPGSGSPEEVRKAEIPSPEPAPPMAESRESTSEKTEPATAPKKPESPDQEKFVTYRSVLQGFKDFKGEPTAKKLTDLFGVKPPPGFTQAPAIALADGKSTVTLAIAAPAGEEQSPQFALKGARQLSLKKGPEGSWIMEVVPRKDVTVAVVTVIRGNVITEYPLVVAPVVQLKIDRKNPHITENDFAMFLKERGSDRSPRYDFNGDGKRDYIDDYIYTANYLLALRSAEKAKAAEKVAPEKKPTTPAP